MTIPAGQTSSAPFYINAVDNGIVDSGNTVTITASAPGSGYTLGTADLTVTNTDVAKTVTVIVNPSTFAENAGSNAAMGTVTVSVASTSDLVDRADQQQHGPGHGSSDRDDTGGPNVGDVLHQCGR